MEDFVRCSSEHDQLDLAMQVLLGKSLLIMDTKEHTVFVIPLTFGRARITLGRAGDFLGYEDSW